jgi:hypothetical protein
MSSWAGDELDRIGEAEELQLASLRSDGTRRKPVTIWVVRRGGDIYVRSVYGRGSAWFRGTQDRHEGHISAGGVEKEVGFVDVGDDALLDEIGSTYRTKYSREPAAHVDPMLTPEARAATLRLEPRS